MTGKYDGIALRLWVTASDGGGIVSPTGRYARYCALALRRPPEEDDPVGDLERIFAGRRFVVKIGYRKTEKQRGGMASDENALRRKDERDFLRVHDILSLEEI